MIHRRAGLVFSWRLLVATKNCQLPSSQVQRAAVLAPHGSPRASFSLAALERWRLVHKTAAQEPEASPVDAKHDQTASPGDPTEEEDAATIAARQWKESGYLPYMENQRKEGWKT